VRDPFAVCGATESLARTKTIALTEAHGLAHATTAKAIFFTLFGYKCQAPRL
jgi:hypothetical protein